ncbi:hypothetical protein, partial [Thauera linaloolentis]
MTATRQAPDARQTLRRQRNAALRMAGAALAAAIAILIAALSLEQGPPAGGARQRPDDTANAMPAPPSAPAPAMPADTGAAVAAA